MKRSIVEKINKSVQKGIRLGIGRLYTDTKFLNGRTVHLAGKEVINFQSCSYLGLELDDRLKLASVNATMQYGTQVSCSRTYLSCGLYHELEELAKKIFGKWTIITQSTSMGHSSIMPIIMQENELVVFDQQAHISMQDTIPHLTKNKVQVEFIKHNSLNALKRILDQQQATSRVWYVMDGIYSMFGDAAPLDELSKLLDEYPNLYLYCDDAHGMSWEGENGSGYVKSHLTQTNRMVLAVSMAKAVGSAGGVFSFPTEEMMDLIYPWGRALSWSGPQQPSVINACIASFKIHLSDEIYSLQKELKKRINYCHSLLQKYKLPILSDKESPIFFVALGMERVTYNLCLRLKNKGILVDIATFPAVPIQRTGIRFCITNHLSFQDIEYLANQLVILFPVVMQEEERTIKDLKRAFHGFKQLDHLSDFSTTPTEQLSIQREKSIKNIPKDLWNALIGTDLSLDYNALLLLEKTFTGNLLKEHNWTFDYLLIQDKEGQVITLSLFTSAWMKEDMLANAATQDNLERVRKFNSYYLSNKNLINGTPLTNGDALYINFSHPEWEKAVVQLTRQIETLQKEHQANTIILRDLAAKNSILHSIIQDQSFTQTEQLPYYVLDLKEIYSIDDYLENLPSRKRYHIRKNVLEYKQFFAIKIVKNATEEQIKLWYRLYQEVRHHNNEINDFILPYNFFSAIAVNSDWEIIELFLKESSQDSPVAVLVTHYSLSTYNWLLIGMNYDYLQDYNLYKQAIYQVIKRAIELKANKIYMGVTSRQIKEKFGATQINTIAYGQMKENLNQQILDLFDHNPPKLAI